MAQSRLAPAAGRYLPSLGRLSLMFSPSGFELEVLDEPTDPCHPSRCSILRRSNRFRQSMKNFFPRSSSFRRDEIPNEHYVNLFQRMFMMMMMMLPDILLRIFTR